jgi:hypothetical protein
MTATQTGTYICPQCTRPGATASPASPASPAGPGLLRLSCTTPLCLRGPGATVPDVPRVPIGTLEGRWCLCPLCSAQGRETRCPVGPSRLAGSREVVPPTEWPPRWKALTVDGRSWYRLECPQGHRQGVPGDTLVEPCAPDPHAIR